MDMLLISGLAIVNFSIVFAGYVMINKFCLEEEKQAQKHRTMTFLEIELLNKKIEGINVRGYRN